MTTETIILSICINHAGSSTVREQLARLHERHHFQDPRNQMILRVMQERLKRGLSWDFPGIIDDLTNADLIEDAGGFAHISEVAEGSHAPGTLRAFASMLREDAARRQRDKMLEEKPHPGETLPDFFRRQLGAAEVVEQGHTADTLTAFAVPTHRSVFDLVDAEIDPEDTLLGDRFLCRRGAMLFVGPSGVGKSSSSMQQDLCWAIGREAFGIKPARPLRIMTIQAENDDGDLKEMAEGVLSGLHLTDEDRELIQQNTSYRTIVCGSGESFLNQLRRLLASWPCDIVRIDPLFAFYGSRIEDAEKLGAFLRGGINPIIHEHRCAAIIAHHTPKITNRDTSQWSAVDYSYSGAGGAELTNWARAVLVLDATPIHGTFKWIAAKRGGRIGWRNDFDEKEVIRYYRHSRREGVVCWEDCDTDDVENEVARAKAQKAKKAAVDPVPIIEELVPASKPIGKNELLAQVNARGAGKNPARDALTSLLNEENPRFFEHLEKRTGTNPRKLIARFPQS